MSSISTNVQNYLRLCIQHRTFSVGVDESDHYSACECRKLDNEDKAPGKDGVSVVGTQDSGATPTSNSCSSCSKPLPYERLVKSYRDKLEPLRSNLADIDRKIQMAKEAHGNASEDTAAWIKVYDGKRKDILAKTERIEDEARRAGVLPGDLRE